MELIHAEVVMDDFMSPYIDLVFGWNEVKGFNYAIKNLLGGGKTAGEIRERLKSMESDPYDLKLLPPDRSLDICLQLLWSTEPGAGRPAAFA
ncbi:MAG TPA: hypothetical protein PKD08_07920 [Gudongella oleilytica]|nr:hypothetical protein [Gudongella oleilytica]